MRIHTMCYHHIAATQEGAAMKLGQRALQALAAIALATASLMAQATPSTSYYIYDEAGHVIGEYDQNGNPVQEHVYLGDRPVAVVQNNTTLDYVTTDQLNTPRAVTDSSGTVQWSWASDPFGNGQPTSSSLTYNLRFPGQYYDAETGHNYNYFRDYDPTTGRYVESDPIGLAGGIDSYTYAIDNPEIYADFYGTAVIKFPSIGPTCNTNSDGYCKQYQDGLNRGKAAIENAFTSGQISVASYNRNVQIMNEVIASHNARCPNYPVTFMKPYKFVPQPVPTPQSPPQDGSSNPGS